MAENRGKNNFDKNLEFINITMAQHFNLKQMIIFVSNLFYARIKHFMRTEHLNSKTILQIKHIPFYQKNFILFDNHTMAQNR